MSSKDYLGTANNKKQQPDQHFTYVIPDRSNKEIILKTYIFDCGMLYLSVVKHRLQQHALTTNTTTARDKNVVQHKSTNLYTYICGIFILWEWVVRPMTTICYAADKLHVNNAFRC